jgi:uncharacterized delta-60 repeat protein
MQSLSTLARVATLSAFVALAACGGGSDGPTEQPGGQTPPPPPPPPPAGFTLALSTDKALVIEGRTATVTATVTRHGAFDAAVTVTLKDLPAGVSAAPVVIGRGATQATVTLSARDGAPHSLPTAASADGVAGDASDSEALTVTVGGEPGVVDTSFNGGKQVVSVGEGEDYARAVAVQADGRIVTVGMTSTITGGADFAVTRHLRDGTLDTTFGNGGKVVTAIGPDRAGDEANAVAIQADGKIVVAGQTTRANGSDIDFALVRYNADGTLDAGFGDGGKVVTAFGPATDRIHAIVIQADGRIVVAGDSDSGTAASGLDFALARYDADGTLDAGFGTAGKVTTPIRAQGARDSAYAVLLQPVGGETRIVAVGGEGDFIAARYTANGAPDPSFGSAGRIAGVFGTSTIGSARAATLVDGNRIVIAGSIQNDHALARLNADGSLDAGFGTAGTVITPLSASWDAATAIVRQADGKLLVGGWVYAGPGTKGNYTVLRYAPEGRLDAGFGTGGKVVTPITATNGSEMGRAVALQTDARVPTVRLLQAGEVIGTGGYHFGLLRYWL